MATLVQRRLVLLRLNGCTAPKTSTALRTFTSTPQRNARKDTMDKDSIKTESNEYSKSGSDSQAAHTDAAFSRDKTRPEEQQASSDRGSVKDSPLNESPANKDFSKPKSASSPKTEGSAAEDSGNSSRERTSSGGSPNKQGGKA